MTSDRLEKITDHVLWWPLMRVEKMKPGKLKFVCTILVLPLAIPCTLMAVPFMFATVLMDIWEDSHR